MIKQKKRQLSFTTYEAYKKIKKDDTIKILFEAIDWSFIPSLIKDTYPTDRELIYDPIALFKSQILIWLGEAGSNRKLANALRFNSRLCVLCGFDNFLKTPAHSTFSYFRKRIGKDNYYKILQHLISQLIIAAFKHEVNINSKRLHVVMYDADGNKSCNCGGNRCKFNLQYINKKNNLKTCIKIFIVDGFKIKMIIDKATRLPIEVILKSKED